MAKPSIELILALRETAKRLQNGAIYAWGHHGSCNCGNLIQVVTDFSKAEIIKHAQASIGEWTEISEDFCPVSNVPLLLIINKLETIGINSNDIHHIEYLSDKSVLEFLPNGFRWLERNKREDVIEYFLAFAAMLEEQILKTINYEPIEFQDPLNLKSKQLVSA